MKDEIIRSRNIYIVFLARLLSMYMSCTVHFSSEVSMRFKVIYREAMQNSGLQTELKTALNPECLMLCRRIMYNWILIKIFLIIHSH